MIEEAVNFAAWAHQGAVRKGTKIPYITHPLETAVIVSMITQDEELIAAALLHDVIEDSGVTWNQLQEKFGTRVADLVQMESEDKTRSWKERKSETLEHLKTASEEIRILTLGDKLSNMRSTARDYLAIGDDIWQRFNEKKKECHAWYYWGIAKELKDMQDNPFYQEFVQLCRYVFGEIE